MIRRKGRFTKSETAELLILFNDGNSIYKICRTINRSQAAIRNNLISLGKIQGQITQRKYINNLKEHEEMFQNSFVENLKYVSILSILVILILLNRGLNPVETLMDYIYALFKF